MHIVRFQGGFANQLFQLAFFYKLKEEYDDVYAEISSYKIIDDHGGYKIGKYIKLPLIELPEKKVLVTEENYNLTRSNDSIYYYTGYWQSKEYFPKDMSFLNKILNESILFGKNMTYLEQIKCAKMSVSLHVRRGDYINNFLHGNIATLEYYMNAMEYLEAKYDDIVYFVFSDDIKWCKENLKSKKAQFVFVEGNNENEAVDMLLMSRCKCNVVANSSFSWWAQQLNKNRDKLVISPEYWFNEDCNVTSLVVDEAVHVSNCLQYREAFREPEFSICITTYNTGKLIRRCLSSVLNQSFHEIEVILVDDGSKDNTLDIIDEYVAKDARVKVIKHEKNMSPLTSRIDAMRLAIGNYILFVDADDYLDIDSCNILKRYLSYSPVDIIEFAYRREPERIVKYEKKNFDDMPRAILERNYPHHIWNKCYSKKLITRVLEGIDAFYCNMSEDCYLSVAFFMNATGFEGINEVLYHYMTKGGISTSNNIDEQKILSFIGSIDNKTEKLRKYISDRRSDLESLVEYSKMCDLEFLRKCCINADGNLYNKLGLLETIDNAEGTKYVKEYEDHVDKCLIIYDDLNSTFRKRLITILKLGYKVIFVHTWHNLQVRIKDRVFRRFL